MNFIFASNRLRGSDFQNEGERNCHCPIDFNESKLGLTREKCQKAEKQMPFGPTSENLNINRIASDRNLVKDFICFTSSIPKS